MNWDVACLTGPENEDWRVPVSELQNRQRLVADSLLRNNLHG